MEYQTKETESSSSSSNPKRLSHAINHKISSKTDINKASISKNNGKDYVHSNVHHSSFTNNNITVTSTDSTDNKKTFNKVDKQRKAQKVSNKNVQIRPYRVKVGSVAALRYKSPLDVNIGSDSQQQHGGFHEIINQADFHYKCFISSSTEDTTITMNSSGNFEKDDSISFQHPLFCSNNNDKYFVREILVDPQPGRDCGLALIGRKIEVTFPNTFLTTKKDSSSTTTISSPDACTVQGEVVSILKQSHISHDTKNNNKIITDTTPINDLNTIQSEQLGFQVLLLIHESYLNSIPYLKQVQDFTFQNDNLNDNNQKLSSSEKRRRSYESRIQGHGTVFVVLSLRDIYQMATLLNSSQKFNGKKKNKYIDQQDSENNNDSLDMDVKSLILPWKIFKKVYTRKDKFLYNHDSHLHDGDKYNGCLYVGDVNDSKSQQRRNWNWICSELYNNNTQVNKMSRLIGDISTHHKDENRSSKSHNQLGDTFSDSFLLGKVLRVFKNEQGMNDTKDDNSLATVILRKLYLPEHTKHGRSSLHGYNEAFYDIATVVQNIQGNQDDVFSKYTCYEVPIEDLIVLSSNVDEIPFENEEYSSLKKILHSKNQHENTLKIGYSYDHNGDVFYPLFDPNFGRVHEASDSAPKLIYAEFPVCHRCRKKCLRKEMKKCSSECCHGLINHNSNFHDTKQRGESWWCTECIRFLRSRGSFTVFQPTNWSCPCCVGVCDCLSCISKCIIERDSAIKRLPLYNNTGYQKQENGISSNLNKVCATCGIPCSKSSTECSICSRSMHSGCAAWEQSLKDYGSFLSDNEEQMKNDSIMKRDKKSLKCFQCSLPADDLKSSNSAKSQDSSKRLLLVMKQVLESSAPLDFDLPTYMFFSFPNESKVAHQRTSKIEEQNIIEKKITKSSSKQTPGGKTIKRKAKESKQTLEDSNKKLRKNCSDENHDDREFNFDSCSRTEGYTFTKKARTSNSSAAHAAEALSLMQKCGRKTSSCHRQENKTAKKSTTGRAARANQRRMLRDVALLGGSNFGVKEQLSGSEQHLRFGKSLIHGWGVFTDAEICAGDLIVEYRGVLIGNAVADKREREYEMSKVGSDYMFRIDADVICDATREGNLARFLNASCTPNCYTKIVTINGRKRIAIFAKKNIMPGEELCYDYKFEPEFDESKRIPCNCGTSECRGFMNWDKRYVAIKDFNSGK